MYIEHETYAMAYKKTDQLSMTLYSYEIQLVSGVIIVHGKKDVGKIITL